MRLSMKKQLGFLGVLWSVIMGIALVLGLFADAQTIRELLHIDVSVVYVIGAVVVLGFTITLAFVLYARMRKLAQDESLAVFGIISIFSIGILILGCMGGWLLRVTQYEAPEGLSLELLHNFGFEADTTEGWSTDRSEYTPSVDVCSGSGMGHAGNGALCADIEIHESSDTEVVYAQVINSTVHSRIQDSVGAVEAWVRVADRPGRDKVIVTGEIGLWTGTERGVTRAVEMNGKPVELVPGEWHRLLLTPAYSSLLYEDGTIAHAAYWYEWNGEPNSIYLRFSTDGSFTGTVYIDDVAIYADSPG